MVDGSMTTITEAALRDAPLILALQREAYQGEARLHDEFGIAPLRQTLEELEREMGPKVVLKAVAEDGGIVGSVRAWEKDGTCMIERVIVAPALQGRGIGTSLMREVEARFAGAARFELFTGHKSARNLRFYAKLGYREFRRQRVSDKLTLVHLVKRWWRGILNWEL